MARWVELVDDEGGTVWVEMDSPSPAPGWSPKGGGGMISGGEVSRDGGEASPLVEKAHGGLAAALQPLKATARAFVAMVQELEVVPDEVELSFGMKMSGELGTRVFVITKAGAEANFTIKLKWTKK